MLHVRSFARKILLAASLVVVAAFGLFALYQDQRQQDVTQRSLEAELSGNGRLLAYSIHNWLEGRGHLVSLLARQLQASDQAPATVRGLLDQEVYAKLFLSTSLGSAQGSFTSAPDTPMPPGYDPRTRVWYKQAAAGSGLVITEPYLYAGTNRPALALAHPIVRDGRLTGVAAGAVALDAINAMLEAANPGADGYAFLVSEQGQILLHPRQELLFKNLGEAYPQLSAQRVDGLQEFSEGGKSKLLALTPISGLPGIHWQVALVIDKAAAYRPLTEFRRTAYSATALAVLAVLLLLGALIHWLLRPLREISGAMQDIAGGEGDLTRRLNARGTDELAELAHAFNRFVARIHDSVGQVARSAHQLHAVARQVLSTTDGLVASSDEQSSRTTSMATAIVELGATAQEIAHSAADASTQASDARRKSEAGSSTVAQTLSSIGQLSDDIASCRTEIDALASRTLDIGKILDVIQGVSAQTNLLALNAAIEAARAGDAGRGFAVVADEVRGLAHRTQASAQEIQQMIEELQSGADRVVAVMTASQLRGRQTREIADHAGQHLSGITALVGDMDGLNHSVATATEEQTTVIDSLAEQISEISLLNQDGLGDLRTTLDACVQLEEQAGQLLRLVSGFRI
ncbi:methyl-accepting chemotaxis protein [Pseudomonas japonica]|uniref:Methyl-accepting chemotaxis sensory transducer with Cache sensor n=1 Tax=Pseudomonas japonica TaxID=256466 RepID=A0A239GJS8_9PSED|nr:methyl-accepting chemotaxis protein [Pseudomonas japonica]SNS69241.1 methyl-accepting chemotaxis sensory transducer with Cache sensor [Pseudomonas japonica]